MKRIIVYIVISLSMAGNYYANGVDTISVHDMVHAQIAEAKAKQIKHSQQKLNPVLKPEVQEAAAITQDSDKSEISSILYKIIILASFSACVSVYVFYKRKKNAEIVKKM